MSTKVPGWPVVAGTYKVGDPQGPVAVCTLTSERLMGPLAGLRGVAIAGMVYTANLGITRIVMNINTNPNIRFLLVCGKDSAIFQPGQSLVALAEHGVDNQRQIIGATGYEPTLATLASDQIMQFRKQVEVVDWTGEEDLQALQRKVSDLSLRNPGIFKTGEMSVSTLRSGEQFTIIRPGGQREPLLYDPKGYFVISIDWEQKEIILRHYSSDHTPAHEMHGRGATSMLLGLIRDGLVTQLSHAGYLGEELAKAQTALQFGLRYDQDRPLRPRESASETTTAGTLPKQSIPESANSPEPSQVASASMPRINPAMALEQFQKTEPGTTVDLVLIVTDLSQPNILRGTFLEPDAAEPFNLFRRSDQRIEVQWTPTSQFIMGGASDLSVDALLRVVGALHSGNLVHAEQMVILTRVARIA